MAFVELVPKKIVCSYEFLVKITFIRHKDIKGCKLTLRIRKVLADKIGIKKGDRVSFSYDEDDKRTWLIKKTDSFVSYTMGGDAKGNILTLQIAGDLIKLFELTEDEFEAHYVRGDIYQESIRINARPIEITSF
jgi:hypothetical protein